MAFLDKFRDELGWITLQTNREYHMGLKLQGLAAKYAKFAHDAEFEAEKLDSKIEGAAAKMPAVFSGAHTAFDAMARNVDGIEAAFKAVESVTNGGPALVPPKEPQSS